MAFVALHIKGIILIFAAVKKPNTLGKYLSLVKFSHTIFAMPFALSGFFLAWFMTGYFDWWKLGLVILCMIFARNAAMAFNRYIDRDIDAQNVRTKVREIPAGQISARNALLFVVINAALFVTTTFFINMLCFALSPVALAVILGYSLTKRFTALCHLILGLGLGLAPVGAFLAVTGWFHIAPVLLGIAVLTWVGGFDIIYAMQDEQFDRERQLHSIPAAIGGRNALILSTVLHLVTAAAILYFTYRVQGEWLAWTGAGLFVAMLAFQHSLVSPKNLSRVNLAFFTTNGVASVIFGICFISDLAMRQGFA